MSQFGNFRALSQKPLRRRHFPISGRRPFHSMSCQVGSVLRKAVGRLTTKNAPAAFLCPGAALKNVAMPRLVDHHASRALAYRTRAIELAMQAKREDDPGQRRFLLDLARNMVNVADALAPLPPDEPQVFRSIK